MTKEQALRMALEALEYEAKAYAVHNELQIPKTIREAITAIKEALAQPKQEPVAWMGTDIEGNPNKFRLNQFSGSFPLYAQTQPWTDDLALIAYLDGVKDGKKTTPPQRTWVGLTEEDKHSIEIEAAENDFTDLGVILATESKLKEKNNG